MDQELKMFREEIFLRVIDLLLEKEINDVSFNPDFIVESAVNKAWDLVDFAIQERERRDNEQLS